MAKQKPSFRGIGRDEEVNRAVERVDIRPPRERFKSWMSEGDGMIFMAVLVAGFMFVAPIALELTFIAGMLLFRWAGKIEQTLPFRMPATSGLLDINDPKPGGTEPGKAAGIAFLGNERGTRKELWFKRDDMRTHLLIFGSTGSGKALPHYAQVHTPSGWVRMDQVRVGDAVSTADGDTARIANIYPQGQRDLMRLVLEDGRVVDCDHEHLWAVLPYRETAPLQPPQLMAPDLEVITALELEGRLERGDWVEGSQGWALPLPEAPDANDALLGGTPDWLASQAIRALEGKQAFPAVVATGSLAQRTAFWEAFWPLAPVAATVGRGTVIRAQASDAADALAFLARSMGWWAKVEADEQGAWVVIRRDEQLVRIQQVIRLDAPALCSCIELDNDQGLFLTDGWVVTHNTEALISMAYNALVQGSGFIYIDGKGDNGLWAKIFSICRSLGREDELLVINYMTGGRDVFGPQKTKLSNTMNPFSHGSSSGLTQLLVSLMDEAGGDAAMWKGRAIALMSAVLSALVYMRDNEGLLLDVDVIRSHLVLEDIQALAKQRHLPNNIISPIRAYLRSLPGFQENLLPGKTQNETALEQHGYLQMQFTRILGSLSDEYGYIFRTNLGEVDFHDVVVNRRILVVLLPAMEKSTEELGNLGKIIVGSLKSMMATGLGDILEGDYADVIETKPTDSPSPYMCILDEYGYYVVKGASVMPAQARSLGFCMVFAGQDFPSFKKNNNQEEAAATIGNCNIKIWMKIEDPTDTFQLFQQSVGEATVASTTGQAYENGLIAGAYRDQKNAKLERRNRGEWLDLKDQREGEAHIVFKSMVVRATMFYANPQPVKELQLNYYMRVEPPKREKMLELDQGVEALLTKLRNTVWLDALAEGFKLPLRLSVAEVALTKMMADGSSVRDASIGALVAAHRLSYAALDNLGSLSQAPTQEAAYHDVFGGNLPLDELGQEGFEEEGGEDMPDFDDPYEGAGAPNPHASSFLKSVTKTPPQPDNKRVSLNRNKHERRMRQLEIAAGSDPQLAQKRAELLTKDLEALSHYPSNPPEPEKPSQIIELIEDIAEDDLTGKN